MRCERICKGLFNLLRIEYKQKENVFIWQVQKLAARRLQQKT